MGAVIRGRQWWRYRAGRIAAFQIADANVQRMLFLAHPAERRPSAAVDEISQIVSAETNALYDRGVFALPSGLLFASATVEAGKQALARLADSGPILRRRCDRPLTQRLGTNAIARHSFGFRAGQVSGRPARATFGSGYR